MNFVKFSHLAHTQVGSRIFDGREVLESQRVLWPLKMPCGSSSGAGRDYYRDSRTEATTTLPIPVRIFFLRNSANLFRSKNLFLFQVLYSGVLTFLPVRTIFHRTAQLRDRFLVIQSKKSIQFPVPNRLPHAHRRRKGTCPTQMSEKVLLLPRDSPLCTLASNPFRFFLIQEECGSRDSIPPRSWYPSCLSLDFQSDLCQVQAADRLSSNLGGDDGRTIRPRLGRRSDCHRRNRFRRDRPPSLPPRPRARPRRVAEDSQAGGAFDLR